MCPEGVFGAARTIPNSPILGTDFTYTGQRLLDSGMGGIMDYRARFYSPALMRFLQPDTIIPSILNPQSWNRYSYALNSPIRYSDPTGHLPCEGLWDCIALVAGVIKETAQYIQQNPINISKRLTTNIPVVIPAGYGIKPGIINKAIDLKVGIRVIGRTVGDDLFGPLMGIGAIATILPNQIENVNQGKHLIRDWNEYVGDALVDGAGFITSEISGDIAAAGLLWTGPEGALIGNFAGDIAWGLAWENSMERGGNRQRFINWLGELPEEIDKFKNLLPKTNLPDPVKESPDPWEQIIRPIGTPVPR
ncbi:MAG: RHS repeat-associated core domain-containing protein [Chloroflexota bacterium]